MDNDRNNVIPLEAYLGLATTEELLNEIACRMGMALDNTEAMRALGRQCEMAVESFSRSVLEYRTVDH